jgi:hypothetical protein
MDFQENIGLNGAIGRWLKKAAIAVVNAAAAYINGQTLGALSDQVNKIKEAVTNGIEENATGGFFYRKPFIPDLTEPTTQEPTTQEPNSYEQSILDAWVNKKFTLYFRKLAMALDAALAGTDVKTQITQMNSVMSQMCIVQQYYTANETAGLSANAVNVRMQLIKELFKPLESLIIEELGSPFTATVSANKTDFDGLFEKTVQGQQYACKQFSVSQGSAGGTSQGSAGGTKFTDILESTVLPTNAQPSTQPSTIDKIFKYVGYGVLTITAIGVAKSFFKKK